jgi:hypothetical protein
MNHRTGDRVISCLSRRAAENTSGGVLRQSGRDRTAIARKGEGDGVAAKHHHEGIIPEGVVIEGNSDGAGNAYEPLGGRDQGTNQEQRD